MRCSARAFDALDALICWLRNQVDGRRKSSMEPLGTSRAAADTDSRVGLQYCCGNSVGGSQTGGGRGAWQGRAWPKTQVPTFGLRRRCCPRRSTRCVRSGSTSARPPGSGMPTERVCRQAPETMNMRIAHMVNSWWYPTGSAELRGTRRRRANDAKGRVSQPGGSSGRITR